MSTEHTSNSDMTDQVLTTDEAAAILNVTPARVRHFLKEQRFGRKKGGRWFIFRQEVERFAMQDRPSHRPPKEN